jgi:hypothetical protein
MTVCATESAVERRGATGHHGLVIAADGSYAARLTVTPQTPGGWFVERWTLGGPEPYAVPLPGPQPEEPGCRVLPLADGRVLVARPAGGRHDLVLLYPSGPRTAEVPLGAVPHPGLRLLPPAPDGRSAFGLTQADGPETVTTVWRLTDGADGGRPLQVAQVRGVCTGGAWLDDGGRLLALDRTEPPVRGSARPRTKTVVVNLAAGGRVTPLLELTERSEDRLLLADPDSGLLLVRSDAPGTERLGWCVLGSARPARFPEELAADGVRLTPFAVQPGQVLLPESCAVALRVDGPNGTWAAVWRPDGRVLQHIAAPHGWLAGTGLWTVDGELRLPCADVRTPCALARIRPGGTATGRSAPRTPRSGRAALPALPPASPSAPARAPATAPGPARAGALRPVPLQQAPLARRR